MVTHDIPEAISKRDRIIILSQRPAVVAKQVAVSFGEERDTVRLRSTQEYRQCYNTVWKELTR